MGVFDIADGLRTLSKMRDQVGSAGDDESLFARFCLNNIGWSRAQFLQDLWVAYELKSQREGYFVEFGAADGVEGSNTYSLERHFDWSGVVAEPADIWRSATRNNRTCAVDDRCVWVRTGETLTFNQPDIATHSTIDTYSDSDRHGPTRVHGRRYPVQTVSLNDLLSHWGAPRLVDYLSIDTEGSEYDILSAFDFRRHAFRLITVEHNHTSQREKIRRLLSDQGYRRKFENFSHVDDWYVGP